MRVTILGTGYVGLTTAAALAYLGHEVVSLDVDAKKIERLRAGESPIFEPGLMELLALAPTKVRFDLVGQRLAAPAEVVFITVGTPSGPDGNPDMSQVEAAARMIAASDSAAFTVVVNKSTVPIGSGGRVMELLGGATATARFAVASNPEFLREGSAVRDSLYPDRVVVGSDDPRAIEALVRLYRPLLDQSFEAPAFMARPPSCRRVPIVTTNFATAELSKYAANAFLALKISFVNEIAELAEIVGADVDRIADAIGLDARIAPAFLRAGVGWGGSCFGKDTAALGATGKKHGLAMPIVAAAREVNYRQRERAVARLEAALGGLEGKTIGLLGLAFKPHTDDLRDAPALDVARRLVAKGARVRSHDPVAMDRAREEVRDIDLGLSPSAEAAADGADALVLLTEWPAYAKLAWAEIARSLRSPLVLDLRNALPADALAAAGLRHLRVGR